MSIVTGLIAGAIFGYVLSKQEEWIDRFVRLKCRHCSRTIIVDGPCAECKHGTNRR